MIAKRQFEIVFSGQRLRMDMSACYATVRYLSLCLRENVIPESARQPDFLIPDPETILGAIGLHDLTFSSVEGSAGGPEVVAEARTRTDQALQEYFSRCGANQSKENVMSVIKAAAVQVSPVLYSREGIVEKVIQKTRELGKLGVQFATLGVICRAAG
jgi:hypothetical protein